MKDYFVILTGSKNNAGDFLIKHRAKKLIAENRADREIIDFNAWEPLGPEKLEIVNKSKALILMGGPSLQRNMYPGIYKLHENLDLIKSPIVTMGIGWKSIKGNWDDTFDYPLNGTTLKLLDRIKADGLTSSVRDFHTLNVLTAKGYENFLMTGCPAYYDLDYLGRKFHFPARIKKVAFSLGVSFIHSYSMEVAMKDQILRLKELFSDSIFEVVFHHGLDPSKFLKTPGASRTHNERHNEFASWLSRQNIGYVDISGSAEKLIKYYSEVDLHIGYRVHAHIYMTSVNKLSVLISEDGRAKGSKSVIGGMVVDGYDNYADNMIFKVASRIWPKLDRYDSNKLGFEEIKRIISYEKKSGGQRSFQAEKLKQVNYKVMEDFIGALP